MVRQAGAPRIGPSAIQSSYLTFQEWYVERELATGASMEDITAYPTVQMIEAMREWVKVGRPV
jgi:hypothetical protein